MRSLRMILITALIGLCGCWIFRELRSDRSVVHAQQATTGASDDAATIRTETRLVLVDTVVTDKKGNYIRDLAQKDFKVGRWQRASHHQFLF
jgi:hypothetical protein